jgi:hypothetical protein
MAAKRRLGMEALEMRRVFDTGIAELMIVDPALGDPVEAGEPGEGAVIIDEYVPRADDAGEVGADATELAWEYNYAGIDGQLSDAADVDVFQVALPDLGRLFVYLGSDVEDTSTVNVSVLDANGNVLTGNEGSGKEESSYSDISAGLYYVSVSGGSETSINYWLSLEGRRGDDSDTVGDQATPLVVEYGYVGVDGWIESAADTDVFQVNLESTDYLGLYAWADELVAGWQVTLVDSTGATVTPDEPSEDHTDELTRYSGIASGTYYIVASGSSDVESSYWISLETVEPMWDPDIIYMTGVEDGDPGVIDGEVEVVDPTWDPDWVKRTLDGIEGEVSIFVDEVLEDVPMETVDFTEVRSGDDVENDEELVYMTLGGVDVPEMLQTTSVETTSLFSGWHNSASPQDVNGDGIFSPIDVLLVINAMDEARDSSMELNAFSRSASLTSLSGATSIYPDVNGDGIVSPVDAISVINLFAQMPIPMFENNSGGRLAIWADDPGASDTPGGFEDEVVGDELLADEALGGRIAYRPEYDADYDKSGITDDEEESSDEQWLEEDVVDAVFADIAELV